MAKSENNIVTHGLSGKVGDLLVFRQRDGKTIVSGVPRKSGKEASDAQKQQQRKFQQAVLYGKGAQQQPGYIEASAGKGRTPYIVAVADFLNAPSIERIDVSSYAGRVGDVIRILATDDFSVKWVFVRITNADGTTVEEGNAVSSGYEWTFTATAANNSIAGDKIEVFASDLPENIAHDEKML